MGQRLQIQTWAHSSDAGAHLQIRVWDPSSNMGPQLHVQMQNHGSDMGTSSLDLDVGSQLRHRTLALDSDAGPCLRCRTPPPAQPRTNLMNLLHPCTSSHELHGDHKCVARAEPAELKSPQNQALLLTRIPTHCEEGCSPQ